MLQKPRELKAQVPVPDYKRDSACSFRESAENPVNIPVTQITWEDNPPAFFWPQAAFYSWSAVAWAQGIALGDPSQAR